MLASPKAGSMRRYAKFIIAAVSLASGIVVGSFIDFSLPNGVESELRLGIREGEFTNPLLECEIAKDTIASRKQDFSPELEDFVARQREKDGVDDVAAYFRDLNNGPITNVGANELFAPASLLKVPVLISYLKWAEDRPEVLDEKILYSKPVDVGYQQEFAPAVPLEEGKVYTGKELLEHMVKYSDNQALLLLFKRLPTRYQEGLYTLLGVDSQLITDPTAQLTIRQYSIFFRILFNASFLSRSNSEYALNLLTQTTFTDGVVAGVPPDLRVAHKFGERKAADGLQQFHDCGIVYYPNHPYLLCVMTRGTDANKLISSIAEVSNFVYQKIDVQYKGK
jgi:beta-lactamase class A